MLYRLETDERTAGDKTSTVYTLYEGNTGGLAEIWPAHGFNCLRWCVPTPQGPQDLLYRSPEWEVNPVPTRSGIPILFPFPNRIRNGTFRDFGRDWLIPLNDSSKMNAIHGFTPRRPWQVVGSQVNDVSAVLTGEFLPDVAAPESIGLWPSDYRLGVKIRLSANCLRIESQVQNLGTGPLPCGLGFHPYFRFPCPDGEISRYVLHAPAQTLWELEDSLPTGRKIPVPPSLDWNRPTSIGSTQLDTLYGDLGSLAQDESGLLLRATIGHETYPGALQIWTSPDFRESVLFTPVHRQAVCVEPYTCTTDAVNLQAQGIDAGWRQIATGATWSGIVELRWKPEN